MSQWFESTFCAESSSTFFCRRGQCGLYARAMCERAQTIKKQKRFRDEACRDRPPRGVLLLHAGLEPATFGS